MPVGPELPQAWCQRSHHCQAGFSCTAKGLLWGGRFQNPQAGSGSLRSLSLGSKAKTGRKVEPAPRDPEAMCPPLPFLWLLTLSCRLWAASGRLECHCWAPGGQLRSRPPYSLRGIPRNPLGLLVLLLLDSRIGFLEHLCFCPAGGGLGRGCLDHRRLDLWDGSGLSAGVCGLPLLPGLTLQASPEAPGPGCLSLPFDVLSAS